MLHQRREGFFGLWADTRRTHVKEMLLNSAPVNTVGSSSSIEEIAEYIAYLVACWAASGDAALSTLLMPPHSTTRAANGQVAASAPITNSKKSSNAPAAASSNLVPSATNEEAALSATTAFLLLPLQERSWREEIVREEAEAIAEHLLVEGALLHHVTSSVSFKVLRNTLSLATRAVAIARLGVGRHPTTASMRRSNTPMTDGGGDWRTPHLGPRLLSGIIMVDSFFANPLEDSGDPSSRPDQPLNVQPPRNLAMLSTADDAEQPPSLEWLHSMIDNCCDDGNDDAEASPSDPSPADSTPMLRDSVPDSAIAASVNVRRRKITVDEALTEELLSGTTRDVENGAAATGTPMDGTTPFARRPCTNERRSIEGAEGTTTFAELWDEEARRDLATMHSPLGRGASAVDFPRPLDSSIGQRSVHTGQSARAAVLSRSQTRRPPTSQRPLTSAEVDGVSSPTSTAPSSIPPSRGTL
jgi:hypothetical protein